MGKTKREEPRLSSAKIAGFIRGKADDSSGHLPKTRSTMYLPSDVFEQAKIWCVQNRTNLSAMVEKALRDFMAKNK